VNSAELSSVEVNSAFSCSLVTCVTLQAAFAYPATCVPWSALASGVVSISAGAAHSAAVTEEGQVLIWGSNEGGALKLPQDFKDTEEVWVQAT
jgi:alpha-tubulin suppressor-like RCC1 family protein